MPDRIKEALGDGLYIGVGMIIALGILIFAGALFISAFAPKAEIPVYSAAESQLDRIERMVQECCCGVTPTPTCTSENTATPYYTFTPETQTATPTVVPTHTSTPPGLKQLCDECSHSRECADGLTCYYCGIIGKSICVNEHSPNGSCIQCQYEYPTRTPAPSQPTATPVPVTPEPTVPQPTAQPYTGLPSVIYIPYDFGNTDWATEHPEYGPCGSMVYWEWYQLNPEDGVYNWQPIEDYLAQAATMPVRLPTGEVVAKPVAIEILLWDAIVDGNHIGVNHTPPWVGRYTASGSIGKCKSADSGTNCKPICHPNWSDPGWRAQYYRFVRALGARFDGRVAAVIIGTGFDRETTEYKNFLPCVYGGNSYQFDQFTSEVPAVYNAAFPTTPQLLQDTLHGTPVHGPEMASYPTLLTGMKLNGLSSDVEGSRITYDGELVGGVTGASELYWRILPTGYEPKHSGDWDLVYWMLMEGLSTHPWYLDLQEDVVQNALGGPFDLLPFVVSHLNTNEQTAPTAWTILRDTVHGASCWTGSDGITKCYRGYAGDFEFFLHRNDDCAGCPTVATPPLGEGLPEPARSHPYSRGRGRRTNQAMGCNLMLWDIDDQWQAAHQASSLEIVILNQGTDQFRIWCGDAQYNFQKGGALGPIDQWVTIELDTACAFDNDFYGGDFAIDCRGDGDERVHRVIVR